MTWRRRLLTVWLVLSALIALGTIILGPLCILAFGRLLGSSNGDLGPNCQLCFGLGAIVTFILICMVILTWGGAHAAYRAWRGLDEQAGEEDTGETPERHELASRSRPRKALYALAAVPAGYLPLSYAILVVYVPIVILTGREMTPTTGSVMWWIGWTAIWATLVQWPFYIGWAACSRELPVRVRAAWIVAIVGLNMWAMPYFLYCKWKNKTRTGLTAYLRPALRAFLEKGYSEGSGRDP